MVTLDLKLLLLSLLIIAGVVLIVFITVAVANMIKTLKGVNGILADVQVMTDIAAERSKQVNEVVDDVVETIKETNVKIRGNKNIIKAASSVGSLIMAIKNIAAAAEKEKAEEEAGEEKEKAPEGLKEKEGKKSSGETPKKASKKASGN
ncbi:MAG: hypothetical protein LBK04_04840 [Clostridiales Family XIII bacterium]|jgi:hypothetical protein|nr:hypothetical protein [Clostridiales Family XIII bacterium]